MKDKEIKKFVEEEIDRLCSLLDVECEKDFKIEEGDREDVTYIKIYFEGDDLGYMIGNHGRHLDSLQYILQLMVGKVIDQDSNYRVLVDVGGYRKERDSKIESLALQKADDVRILGEEIEMEPMSPADRRVVHTTLSQYEDITTESVGEGKDRRVVIKPIK
ncbi:MAG: R3H domain-containing nucleic acid-binding protein [Candidatus Dojkabacteria bacterium]|jgi:spoIIIJ-associated protein